MLPAAHAPLPMDEAASAPYALRRRRRHFSNPANAACLRSRGSTGLFALCRHLDILIMNRNEPPTLLRNDAPPGNHWIKIRLEGTKSHRSAVGARVLARCNGHVQEQMLTSQSSYLSVNDRHLHFGLGPAASADVEIFWPSGARENYKNLAAGELHTIREGQRESRD